MKILLTQNDIREMVATCILAPSGIPFENWSVEFVATDEGLQIVATTAPSVETPVQEPATVEAPVVQEVLETTETAKPKRKRRTKAEIEAAKAEQAVVDVVPVVAEPIVLTEDQEPVSAIEEVAAMTVTDEEDFDPTGDNPVIPEHLTDIFEVPAPAVDTDLEDDDDDEDFKSLL